MLGEALIMKQLHEVIVLVLLVYEGHLRQVLSPPVLMHGGLGKGARRISSDPTLNACLAHTFVEMWQKGSG